MIPLVDTNCCTGCMTCKAVCPTHSIKLYHDAHGFAYPEIGEDCIRCGKCIKFCPLQNKVSRKPFAFAAYARMEELRQSGSSGGMFPLIAKHILSNGGVVFGAAYNENFRVKHIAIEHVDELKRLSGAKYSQSDLNTSFQACKNYLQQGRYVLFSGTPCQIAGMKSFLQSDSYKGKLLLIDMVCHSVPSPSVWEKYIQYRASIDNNNVPPIHINQRSKETGWSKYTYSSDFAYASGNRYLCQSNNDVFMQLYTQGYISRPSCSNCRFKGGNRYSDITLGDFWGVWNILPQLDDNKGISLLLVNTSIGQSFLQAIQKDAVLVPVDFDLAIKDNPAYYKVMPAAKKRSEVLNIIIHEKKFPKPQIETKRSLIKCYCAELKKVIRLIYHFVFKKT